MRGETMGKFIMIKPEDTIFFRDGKPFEMGVDNFSHFVFPPFPPTFYGALRTAIISSNATIENFLKGEIDKSLKDIVGDKANPGSLEIKGPFLFHIDYRTEFKSVFIPLPYDLLEYKNYSENETTFVKIVPDNSSYLYSNLKYKITPARPREETEAKEPEEKYINIRDLMREYFLEDTFNGEDIFSKARSKTEIFEIERKVGIKLDKSTKSAEENYLYSASHIRLKEGFGFLIEVNIDNELLPKEGYLRIGGETRVAEFKEIDFNLSSITKDIVNNLPKLNGDFLLEFILLTPAVFKNGWFPDFLSQNEEGFLKGKLGEIDLTLKSAVLGKPLYIGGFDLAKGYPKEMKKAVPAGSVYYFKVENVFDSDKVSAFIGEHNFSSIETEPLYKKQGFGITLIGGGVR
jgi:CRISPR-associated protein Cmr3